MNSFYLFPAWLLDSRLMLKITETQMSEILEYKTRRKDSASMTSLSACINIKTYLEVANKIFEGTKYFEFQLKIEQPFA